MSKSESKTYYVYLLRCSDGTLYCGSTNCLERRVAQHNAGRGAKYTRSRTPVTLVFFEELAERGDALKREACIKKLTREEKLRLIGERGAGETPPNR